MVKEFDWINAYDWEKLDAKKFSRERDLVGDVDKIFEGSLKSNSFSYLPKTVSFYTWWRVVDAGSTRKTLMYVLSFTDGDLRGEKRNVIKLNNFVKLAPNLRNISYESPNPYIAGTESWAPSLAKAFQRISWKGTVTSLNYPFVFYNEERVNKQTTRTFVVSSVDYDLFTDENFFELDLPQDFVFEYRVDDIGDSTDMQEIADKIVEDISDETGLIVLGFYFQEKMSDGTLVDLDAESFWGNSGSGVLVVARDTQRLLLGLRSWDVMESNTWGNFGGAIGISDDGEPEEALPPEDNALKEMAEEINYRGPIEMIPSFTYRNNSFTYYNYIGMVNSESQIALNQFNWEISELRWFTLDEVLALPNLHFGISELMRQEEMVTFNAPGIADEEYRTFFNKDFELTNEPQFVLFEELPVITQDDIVYMATHPTGGNPILAEEYAYCHPNYFKRDLQGIEFPTFNANMNDINFPLTQRNRHTPTILKYLEQLQTSNAPPILISGNEFIDGGHRFLAYELAGRRTIPVVDIGNLLTTDLREYLDTGEGDSKELIHQFSAEDNAQNITYDEFGQPYITLYHAGTMDNHELISITGLRTNLPGWDPKTEFETYDNEEGIYFTTNLDKAIKWIGWKYRQEFCDYDGGEQLDETELAPFPNEVAGVVYAVQFPLIKRREILKFKKWNRVKEQYDTQSSYSTLQLFPEDLSKDEVVEDAWVSKQSIPIDELEVVGFYSLPICFSQGWNDGGFGITELTKSEAMDIHSRGFTMERVEWSPNSGDYEPIFDSKYKPRYHLSLPRDSMYSSYKGWFAAESVPMADWNKLSPVELVDLISFPSDDGHGDAWVMYIPRDWPHHAVLDKAEDEIIQRLRALPQGVHPKERRKIFDETYSKYFDFWYIPGTEYSITGGGYQELTQSIQDDYENDYFKEEAEKRGIPFDTNLSLEEARKYLPKSTVDWAEKNNRLPHIYAQAIVKAMIQDYLDLGRDKIFYTPLLAAAPMDAEVGTDASKESNLIAGWHRDAYANILYQQDPSQGGAPTVFFKPKEEYL
jgi:8-oxo-dGTP pyrophosphatase MutT (NUDIX family)/2-hydroxychromene-2-carboxylate isomerase